MTHFPPILADDFGSIAKLIVPAIVVVFWAIRALAALAEKSGAPKPPAIRPISPAVKQNLAASEVRLKQMTAPKRQIQPPPRPPRQSLAPMPPPVPQAAAPVVAKVATPASPATGAPMTANAIKRTGGATASSLRRWLKPDTMRKQFILTELLQPPTTLRERE